EPSLVVEVSFTEFTSDGVVRHGVVKGIREDKDAAEVVLETPAADLSAKPAKEGNGKEHVMAHETRDRFAGVKLSNPTKVLFADQGVTKADLAAHYERVAGRMLPLIEKRLLSLV